MASWSKRGRVSNQTNQHKPTACRERQVGGVLYSILSCEKEFKSAVIASEGRGVSFRLQGWLTETPRIILRGRWDRDRTCNLRFWSTRRGVQRRLGMSNTAVNSRFFAVYRPTLSKNV
jgi:hypothetical protein